MWKAVHDFYMIEKGDRVFLELSSSLNSKFSPTPKLQGYLAHQKQRPPGTLLGGYA